MDTSHEPSLSATQAPLDEEMPSGEERQWAMLAHLSALLGGLFTGAWMGWGCFIGPLIIWLVKRENLPFVADQAREALNFNITIAIVAVSLSLLTIMTFGIGLLVTIPLAVMTGIYWLVCVIMAATKANKGMLYRYPYTLRLIK